MRKSRSLGVLATLAMLSVGFTAVPAASAGAATVKSGGTLHVVMPWGSILSNFNPLTWNGGTGTTAGGTLSLLYEPIFYNNPYTGAITPLLGTSYKWQDQNLKLVVTTRGGVKWSDGKSFSAGDVAFTFNELKKFPALDALAVWKTSMKSVAVTGPNTVTFSFSSPYVPIFPLLAQQPIVPRHIFASVPNPTKFTNPHPVGTGPFLLKSYSAFQVAYVKNPHYWMTGKPYLNGVVMTAVKSNTTAQLLMLNGSAAYTYTYITDPVRTFTAKSPYLHYWWPGYQLNLLYFNTARAPFHNVAVRKAIAQAINTKMVANRAYYGALGPGHQTAMASGLVSAWVPSSLSSMYWKYSPSAARATLKNAGYKIVGGQLQAPNGKALPTFDIMIGGPGWTDYVSIAQTISRQLKLIGISTNVVQDTFATYYSNLQMGNYDMAVSWNNNNYGSPYYAYYALLSSKQTAPVGSAAATNWERFTHPSIDSALNSYASTADLTTQQAAMTTIEKSVLTNVPVVSLTDRANWFDYSSKYFTGWPSASNPYNAGEAPDAAAGGTELLYLNVHLK
jgi:peptide/nickel transport system substrate-binding protein